MPAPSPDPVPAEDAPRVLLGPRPGADWTANLEAVAAAGPLPPFDPRTTGFVGALSRRILTDPAMRAHPDLMAFAHETRPARLAELAAAAPPRRRARGLVFHVAPANVDTVFAHSWLLAALAGNGCAVRLSRRRRPAQDLLLATAAAVLADPAWDAVRARTLVLAYGHETAVSARLSAACDLRVTWGGDAAVAAMRAVPLPPHAEDLAFPDRFSAAMLDATAVRDATAAALADLARGFANDLLWFDQAACSSPRLLAWIGDAATVAAARDRFWPAVDARVAETGWRLGPAETAARLSATYAAVAAGLVGRIDGPADGTRVVRATVDRFDDEVRAAHPGLGLVLERRADDPAAGLAGFGVREQTLTVFGIAPETVLAAIDAHGIRTVDRIVPVGRALAFAPVWDGHDLLDRFSRRIGLA